MRDQMFQQTEMKNDIRNFILFIPSAMVIMAMMPADIEQYEKYQQVNVQEAMHLEVC